MNSDRVFVDTNVLVYARDASEPSKQPQAAEWMASLWRSKRGRLSTQVLSEYYQTVTRKLDPGLDRETARADVEDLMRWNPTPIDDDTLAGAWMLEDRFALSWWDALIVAAARQNGCRHLLSEDLQHGQVFDDVEVVNPFSAAPP
ncbi:MAG: PIN domain-containing protein [Wenzhouxiangellaceae bacterium]|nr:PIN domain-containing protein [Wenzhouxiangellaceae bacterium]